MGVFHQMGHYSNKLLHEEPLRSFTGAILSPVNYSLVDTTLIINNPPSANFEFIFDPQLYYPQTDRGHLPRWPYFPSDVDTANQASLAWWRTLNRNLAKTVRQLHPAAVCSPAIVPRVHSLDYYALNRDIAADLQEKLEPHGVQVLHSVLVLFDSLADRSVGAEVASIVTGADARRAYLVLISALHPRREFRDTEALKGAMRLIRLLEEAGVRVLVGFTSSDLVLWKASHATDCATGKFFNLRRFTPSRWEPPSEAGGQLPYWFEEAMMGFLRETDLIRVRRAGFLSQSSLNNPYAQQILNVFDNQPHPVWLGLSWRHYMYWFADFESKLTNETLDPNRHLRDAEGVWDALEERDILMEERDNKGDWLRFWRRALLEAFQ